MDAQEKKAYAFGMIFLLSNKMQNLGDKLDPQLTVKQWIFLTGVLRCESHTPTLSQVAARIGSSRQNVKKIALLLEKQGFVFMEKDVNDARAIRIHLTDTCLEHLESRNEMERRFLEELFDGFSAEDLTSLTSAMEELEKNVNKMERKYEEEEA
ncbi:MarR family winged helix-turn-helix transcriptional regulator [Lacrimispora defluvii]|uniref:MarR family transcriptional regulator n=1 Tax=Lacrimispora defluvii TaxID=2719233 RepID=A0ABX1VYC6_9FIRM|nr:MarR family transcriptional regulator [Lacrimispora defluvii]NNJ32857.1 MarR family transcriptional regulator [Lacrimispora defluvii]